MSRPNDEVALIARELAIDGGMLADMAAPICVPNSVRAWREADSCR